MVAKSALLVAFVAIAAFWSTPPALSLVRADADRAGRDWRSDWSVQRGFEVTVDAQGFQFPTSIAFVPDPGSGPGDPLYFVTELLGTVKVVTNDRTVYTFAGNLLQLGPDQKLPEAAGMAGICVDPQRGYVFVTFVRPDQDNVLRNRLVRLQSEPEIFSLAPTSQTDLSGPLAPHPASRDHQIGPCQVKGDLLYVSMGDGAQPQRSQQLDSLLGKVLRMTLDGRPAPDNPYYQDDNTEKPANYVWAAGFRNPFGLKIVGESIFVADNGPAVDRFLQIREGGNYLWDGTDFSIGASADAVLFPGKGVAQLDYYPEGSNLFPSRFRESFFLTVTGSPSQQLQGVPAIMEVPYDFTKSRVKSVPSAVLRYRGEGVQVVAGLGFGPDGLYFLPLMPNEDGTSPILKLQYNPAAEYPYLLETESNPIVLMNTHGCFACHTLDNNAGGTTGPVLDRALLVPRVQARLDSGAYASEVGKLDKSEQEPFRSFRQARQAIRQTEGLEKVRLWVEFKIQEPRFDSPNAQMPNLGISEEQARVISAYLSGIEQTIREPQERGGLFRGIVEGVRGWFPRATRANAKRYGAALFGVGALAGGIVALSAYWVVVRVRRGGRFRAP